MTIEEFTPIRIEWNSTNGFMFLIFSVEAEGKINVNNSLFGIHWSPDFLLIELFYRNIKVYDKTGML